MRILKKDAAREGLSVFFCCAAFMAALIALLIYPQEIKASFLNSINYCLTVLIPSLFPFMALVSFAVNSGASEAVGKLLGGAARYIFRLPPCCTAPVILSFIAGYPAGAKAASQLLKSGYITEKQAGRMLLFCVNPGIAFVVTFIGSGLLGNTLTGWVLFLSVTLSGIVLGAVSCLFEDIPKNNRSHPEPTASRAETRKNAFIISATDACTAMVRMCICVALFSCFSTVFHASGLFQLIVRLLSHIPLFSPAQWASLLSFTVEVTEGAGAAFELRAGGELFAFGLAFGGLCVHMQVFSFFKELPVKKLKFFAFRFLHALSAMGIFKCFSAFMPEESMECLAVAPSSAPGIMSTSFAGGLSLLLMSCAFLFVLTKGNCKSRENVV